MMKYVVGIAAALAVLLLVTHMGAVKSEIEVSTPMFDSEVVAWAKMGAGNSVEQIGVDIPLSLIENAPEGEMPPTLARLQFPEIVSELTFFDHVDVDYNPGGHPPGPYLVPHFDIHFYGISEEAQLAIDCTDRVELGDGVLPDHHIVTQPGLAPDGECVPEMGHHGINVRSPELDPEAPQPFTKTMILGYYAGELTFLEPMVTKEFLLQKQAFTLPVILPEVLPRETQFPTAFYARYNQSRDVFQFIWSEFEMRD